MTLEALQYLVTDLALKHNLVNCAMSGPSIYAINPEDIKEYPLIFVSPTGTHTIKENTTRYSLTFFYMDRLFEDSSNEETINSAGIETLRNLKLQLSKIEVVTDIQEDADIRLFTETERMADRVAGAYMTIWIETLNPSTCPAFFDEYGFYMGNYFATEGLENVLDGLASKEWVERLIAGLSISGITPEEFERIMGKYVLEKNFATINGSKITNKEVFTFVEHGEYSEQIEQILQAISAATPSDYDAVKTQVSANTENISTLSAFTSGLSFTVNEHTEIIEQLSQIVASGFKVYIINEHGTQEDINEIVRVALDTENPNFAKIVLLFGVNTAAGGGQYVVLRPYNKNFPFPYDTSDAYFSGIYTVSETKYSLYVVGFTRNSMDVEVHRQDYDCGEFVTQSAYTQDITALYSAISSNTQSLSALSAYTAEEVEAIWNAMSSGGTPRDYEAVKQQVSANTEDIQTLSGITSDISGDFSTLSGAVSGINETLVILSAQTSANTAQIADLSGSTSSAVSSLTQDIETLSQAISGLTPEGYAELQQQVSANTEDIAELSGLTADLSGVTSGLTSDLAALSAFTETLTGISSDDIYYDYDAVTAMTNAERITLASDMFSYCGQGKRVYIKQKIRDGYWFYELKYGNRASDYNDNLYFYPSTLNYTAGEVSNNINRAYNLKRSTGKFTQIELNLFPATSNIIGGVKIGSGLNITAAGVLSNPYTGNVSSETVTTIVSLTQSAYDALATKDANTLYIIKPLY